MATKNAQHRLGANTFKNCNQFTSFANVKQQARHQWATILPGLGLDPAYLRNRHGPCPAYGGKDRFRFDDKDGNGGYYCNGSALATASACLRKCTAGRFKRLYKRLPAG